jgi:Ino eighty subunit 1
MHFDPHFDFLDLFLPANTSPSSRARAFLWLMFHYLESASAHNPFCDDYANQHPGKAPKLTTLTLRQRQLQDVDTAEELAYGRRMAQYRSKFLQKQIAEENREKAVLKHYRSSLQKHIAEEEREEAAPKSQGDGRCLESLYCVQH